MLNELLIKIGEVFKEPKLMPIEEFEVYNCEVCNEESMWEICPECYQEEM